VRNSLVGIAGFMCFAVIAAMAQEATHVPCPTENAPKGWIVYIDRIHGFCFSYPPVYTPSAKSWFEYKDDPVYSQTLRKAVGEGRLLRLQHKKFEDASIWVWLQPTRFDLESFIKGAPTGSESPPEPMKIGDYTFYYYGPGGGGVCYADGYFFNLRGKTLTIDFDGPCRNDKTPTLETKEIERRLLATFRTFQPRLHS
jgi:hypothetical protein